MRTTRVPVCHSDRPHYGRGLCRSCYETARVKGTLKEYIKTSTENLTGRVFGKLIVLKRAENKNSHPQWLCKCECGTIKPVDGPGLRHGLIKSCGCSIYIRPYESLYNYCMFHANREHPELLHTLTFEEFVEFTASPFCHYCGEAVVFVVRNINGARAIRYNLDRKNNAEGYCKPNLVVCCKVCNYTKGNRFTYEQFIEIGKVIRSFHGS